MLLQLKMDLKARNERPLMYIIRKIIIETKINTHTYTQKNDTKA